jgi:hypothetical protein
MPCGPPKNLEAGKTVKVALKSYWKGKLKQAEVVTIKENATCDDTSDGDLREPVPVPKLHCKRKRIEVETTNLRKLRKQA